MTILNEITELIQEGYTWGVDLSSGHFWVALILGLILAGLFGWVLFDNWHEKIYLKIFCICMILFGIFGVITAFHSKPVYREVHQYEVILDDTISFQEIYNKYDIIEQRGQIFVLQEKNQNDG